MSAKKTESSTGRIAAGEIVRDRLHIISHFPGRLRVRAETFRVLPEVGEAVATRVASEPGVSEAKSSPVTGSMLITYDPRELQLPKLVGIIVRAGGLHGMEIAPPDPSEEPSRGGLRVREAFGRANQALRKMTRGNVDVNVALPGTLWTAGIAMFLAGRRHQPMWYDLIFWGFVTFVNLNPRAEGSASEEDEEDVSEKNERRSG